MHRADGSAWEATALVALSFLLLMTAGVRLAAHGMGGIVLGELACVLLPTLAYLAVRRAPAAAIGLGRFPLLGVLGGALFGVAAFYLVAVALHAWVEHVWPTPPEVRRSLERMIVPESGARPLLLDVAAFALVPAVAEELLFRGVFYSAVRPRLGAVGAVVVSAAAFGLYHGSLYRLFPAVLGGLFLGSVRAASGSLWPALAFHCANNVAVVVALHHGWEAPPPTLLPLAAAAAGTLAGLTAVVKSKA